MVFFSQGTGVNTGGLVIYPTQFWHAGRYRCVVQSSSDMVEREAKLTVIGQCLSHSGIAI